MRPGMHMHRFARERGISLIELMVAMAIGIILIFGATKVYVDSRATYEVNERVSRLQETARYAMSVIEPDIRMSNYWGLVKGAGIVTGQAAQTATSAGGPDTCGVNFARDLNSNLQGSNDTYSLSCTTGVNAVGSADTLTVRRAATAISAPTANTLQICSTRIAANLFSDGGACTAAPAGQVNNLLVNTYYIDQNSVQQNGLPSLRRWTLTTGPAFASQEIIPGVEDLQVQFGIDTSGSSGVASRYIDPAALTAGQQIVSVRIWLLVRSDSPEVGFSDSRTYEYADRVSVANGGCTVTNLSAAGAAGCAYAPADRFRRLLVSRTIQIRNALGT